MRLEQLEDIYGDRIAIEWHSFLLRPSPEPRPMEKFTRYTESWERPAAMEPAATFQRWSGEHEPPSDSVPAGVAGKVAETFGPELFKRFHTRLLEAYFTENRTVSDRAVLNSVAAEAGIDVDEFDRRWTDGAVDFTRDVFVDHMTANQSGITGVPAMVMNRKHLVNGAQDLEVYRSVIDKLLAGDLGDDA